MACETEKETFTAAVVGTISATAGVIFVAPGWWKLAGIGTILAGAMTMDVAQKKYAECLRAQGKHAEADILDQHEMQLAADIARLRALAPNA
jgi:hypothetical protein